jgi:farnesyl diphosphate synthase
LEKNYGQKNPEQVELVKKVYKELNLEQVYFEYEEKSYQRISTLIEALEGGVLPKQMFFDFMNRYILFFQK